eukprot:TRINITY_DN10402_c0_g1_i1.p3 TRINITY_DN10402_c0_g1~~TRINITY_DN10402_c0_g1_i1.p3  ORF type:complete len:134 (+),score=5.49 TRINITY_DN10402_c0_g1_i1:1642-2043(+)
MLSTLGDTAEFIVSSSLPTEPTATIATASSTTVVFSRFTFPLHRSKTTAPHRHSLWEGCNGRFYWLKPLVCTECCLRGHLATESVTSSEEYILIEHVEGIPLGQIQLCENATLFTKVINAILEINKLASCIST